MENIEYVVCKICGKKGRVLTDHLHRKHNLSRKEYEDKYKSPAVCYERQLIQIEKNKELNKMLATDPYYVDLMKKVRHRNATLPQVIEARKLGDKRYKDIKGNTVKLRSSLELTLYNYLIETNLKFEYETIRIVYSISDKEYVYIPDFYLPDYNMILEVKPYIYTDNKKNICKKQATIQAGYKFLFVTERELKDLNSFFHNKIL